MNAGSGGSPVPVVTGWAEAPAVITAAAGSAGGNMEERALVVGICGPVGSGKSTLAARLSACVIATDDYLPDYEGMDLREADRPEAADLASLARDLDQLRAGRPAQIPVWSFRTHRRESYRRVAPPSEPGGLIVCEGIHALHATIRPSLDVAVFVEAPAAVRWRRWEVLEQTGQRGWGVERARRFFVEVAEPTFAGYAHEYRNKAHVVVVNAVGS